MYRIGLAFILCTVLAHSLTIDALIALAKKHNPKLAQASLEVQKQAIAIKKSSLLQDPTVQLSINDIPYDNILRRDIEPMQTHTISFAQALPALGELQSKTALNKHQLKRQKLLYATNYHTIIVQLKQTAYALYKLQKLKAITNSYQNTILKQLEINQAASVTQKGAHATIIRSELTLHELELSIKRLDTQIATLYANLSYLTHTSIKSIQLDLDAQKMPPKPTLQTNLALQKSHYDIDIAKEAHTLAVINTQIKPFVQISYNHRQNWADYGSISLGAKLPIYGNTHYDASIAKLQVLANTHQANDIKNNQERALLDTYYSLQEHFDSYTILNQKSLPTIRHLIDIALLDLKKNQSLDTYLGLLKEQFLLQKQSIEHKANFFIALAQLEFLQTTHKESP